MSNKNINSRRISILRDSVVQKIAAGEVIDRPFSVIRELIDNALDAEAETIQVFLEKGGLTGMRITDDGLGMNREDMELCYLPHATSKISTHEDLFTIHSMGFRGEALSSIAACAKLEIVSAASDEGVGYKLHVQNGKLIALEPARATKGTNIYVGDLFYTFPARKKFLKSPSAETSMCKNTFIEKALAFPERNFKLFTDGSMKMFLPADTYAARVLAVYGDKLEHSFIKEITAEGEGFSLRIITAGIEQTRRDRKFIQTYVNRRRISDYSLVHAVEYGFSDFLPGGVFPYAFVFIEIDPNLVDFNIHPAKREAKIKISKELHHTIGQSIKDQLYRTSVPTTPKDAVSKQNYKSGNLQFNPSASDKTYPYSSGTFSVRNNFHSNRPAPSEGITKPDNRPPKNENSFPPDISETINRGNADIHSLSPDTKPVYPFLGQVMGVFLLTEVNNILYAVDQHAAHERMIYDKLLEAPRNIQNLLVPHDFEVSEHEHQFLIKNRKNLQNAGIIIEEQPPDRWAITALPEACTEETEAVIDFLKSTPHEISELEKQFFATVACRAAVKDGDAVDTSTALAIIEGAFSLPNPRCPHGRPVWTEIPREELYKRVKRM